MRYFGLIWGVGCEKLATAYNGIYNRRRVVVVASCAHETSERAVILAQVVEKATYFNFAHGVWQVVLAFKDEPVGYVLIKVIERLLAASVQHSPNVGGRVREILVTHYRSWCNNGVKTSAERVWPLLILQ